MALTAERLGFDAVCTHDHVTWGVADKYHFYAGAVEEADAMAEPLAFLSSLNTLAYVAGLTRRIRLITAALCLAWRHPLQIAREALTLHTLSGGRFVLCLCVGNVKRDFEVTGTPWEGRGRIAVQHLQALRAAIDAPGPASFEGDLVRFQNAELYPRPVGLKLWYGGTTDLAIQRAAKYCEGWMPAGGPEYFQAKIPELRRRAEAAGRGRVPFEFSVVCRTCVAKTDEEAFRVAQRTLDLELQAEWLTRHDIPDIKTTWLVGSPQRVAERILEFERAGVGLIFTAVIEHSLAGMLEQMERFVEDVVPLVRARSGR
jgi:alkanesulfonate monooxygenase SsuD/methylene tetrahydromethanopterin reductase-like flavin-dependent oxidoreductase (luciferase family)